MDTRLAPFKHGTFACKASSIEFIIVAILFCMLPEKRGSVLHIKLYMLSIGISYYTQLTLKLLENFQLLPDAISARVADALPVCVP